MNPMPKTQVVPDILAGRIKEFRVLEAGFIMICRANRDKDAGALGESDLTKRNVLGNRSEETLRRAIKPQYFFDKGRNQGGIIHKSLPVLRHGEQMVEAIPH